MNIRELNLPGLRLIELDVHHDSRGFFTERFNLQHFEEQGLPVQFAQDNHSRSLPGVLRGLHWQHDPGQGKLVGVIRGRVWDVTIDLRAGSPTFGRSATIELSDQNGLMLWVPTGFAHGFCVMGNEAADVIYKVDAPYRPDLEGGIHWADPELNIAWPVKEPIVSPKDDALPGFKDYRANPIKSFQWEP